MSLLDSGKAPGPCVPKAPHPAALGGSEARLMGSHGPRQTDRTLRALRAKARHPFASCCSWISSWRVRDVFGATLIDGFIFQSIYLLNYPTVSKKSFLINMVISRSGWQQKHILVQFVEKADVPQFHFTSGFPHQQSVNYETISGDLKTSSPSCLASVRTCLELSSSQVLPLSHIFAFERTLERYEAHVSFNFSELLLGCQSFSFDNSSCRVKERGAIDTSGLTHWWEENFPPHTKHCWGYFCKKDSTKKIIWQLQFVDDIFQWCK